MRPDEIEKKSFEIISDELYEAGITLPDDKAPVIMRMIHASADFDYAKNTVFSDDALSSFDRYIHGALIVTDTNMALTGINKKALTSLGAEACCFMADRDVAEKAAEKGITRAAVSIDKAVTITDRPLIFVSGNAPTFLIRLCEHIESGYSPALVIAMPVGFVNVEHSKELVAASGVPFIAAMGRKGGSNIAAAAVNALMYRLIERKSL